jgi:hypothetical protein
MLSLICLSSVLGYPGGKQRLHCTGGNLDKTDCFELLLSSFLQHLGSTALRECQILHIPV